MNLRQWAQRRAGHLEPTSPVERLLERDPAGAPGYPDVWLDGLRTFYDYLHEDESEPRTCAGTACHFAGQAPAARGLTADWHRLQSVFIPHGAVGYQPGRHPAHLRIAAGTAVGRVLCAAIEALFAELPRARRAEAAALVPVFCGLVRGLLLTAAPAAAGAREFDAPRRLAMRRYLEERLGEPELGPARLCAAFGASRATVYRDFAEDGGVERFITRRRLERAYHELASGPPERGRVRRVAERWGFACPYHFSRAFRRQFDRWPSDVIETRRAADRGVPPGIVGKE